MNLDRPCSDILTEAWQRYAFANDAGPYLLIPQAILQPRDEQEVQAILAASKIKRIPVCFRAGGTSLSGQSVTDGWLVDIGRHWRSIEPVDAGQSVRVQPGAIGGLVNAHLKSFGRKIGPDPSSINSAMIGGMLSNNSSGMCCGVVHNAYHTLESIRFILPDGSLWDTSRADEASRFRTEKPHLCTELTSIRQAILDDPELLDKIRLKYQQKNTVGYSLNAFVDYQEPLDILSHLLIGAEGTLAFISQAVLKTLPDLPEKATALGFFADAHSACDIIPELIGIQADAVEFMDRASLESIRNLEGTPAELPLRLSEHQKLMGLLFEFQAADKDALAHKLENFRTRCQPHLKPLSPIAFTQNKKEQANLWKLRKGMYPAVAAMRARGEAAILEDITFPLPRLADAILALQEMFRKHQYANGIIFGHAKDGNLHFVISQPMASPQDTDKYARLIDDMVDLVVHRFDGALKSEHGTGRNMAPFVQTEWGTHAVEHQGSTDRRRRRRQVRRMRSLRAQVPEPRLYPLASAADRSAAGSTATHRPRPHRAGQTTRYRLRVCRQAILCDRRTLRAGLPGGYQHRRFDQTTPQRDQHTGLEKDRLTIGLLVRLGRTSRRRKLNARTHRLLDHGCQSHAGADQGALVGLLRVPSVASRARRAKRVDRQILVVQTR